ncbi:hypothetical protein DL96DRAFT_1713222 [Flagelloscypha sp. PMI_526]|nr:hypothetical protein DL96DRAFT_1713222 [Flagelloscypha sp. PMI_526]
MKDNTLPPEIWLQVIDYLPYDSLVSFKNASRTFHQIALEKVAAFLDLAPDEPVAEKRLDAVKRRTELALDILFAIRSLRLTSHIDKNMSRTRPANIVARMVGKTQVFKQPFSPPLSQQVEEQIVGLLPSLEGVHRLSIVDSNFSHSAMRHPCPSISLAWSLYAARLTFLSLELVKENVGKIIIPLHDDLSLPQLRTFRLSICSFGAEMDQDLHTRIGGLLRMAPLLQEVDFRFKHEWESNGVRIRFPESSSMHSKLRVFKWTKDHAANRTIVGSALNFVKTFASQLEVIHLSPAPTSGFWRHLDFAHLVELRADLVVCQDPRVLFDALSHAGVIRILEITGMSPSYAGAHLYYIMKKLPSLREFYCPVHFDTFDVKVLRMFAEKTPNLQKLMLNFHKGYPLQLHSAEKLADFEVSYENPPLTGWIHDFGIAVPSVGVPMEDISVLRPLLDAIAGMVLSIRSFYGTGNMNILDGQVLDRSWFGELKLGRTDLTQVDWY